MAEWSKALCLGFYVILRNLSAVFGRGFEPHSAQREVKFSLTFLLLLPLIC